ncbi:MAG: MFS transporter, partial [Dehalococcoidia bacterium]
MRTDAIPTARTEPRFFYGWTIVGATFVLLFLGFGAAYSFAAFFTSLRDEFDASRGDVSLVFSITAAIYFALGAVSGPLADRVGPRRIALVGVLCMTAGLLLASQAQALWQVYVTYSLGVGIGVGLLYVPAIGTVQRWFVVRRGMASGLAVTGIGVGTLLLPPLTALVIDGLSWRWAYFGLALLSLAAGLVAASVLEHSPGRRGLHADGEERLAISPSAPISGVGTREAVTSRPFILLYAACWLTGVGLFIPFAHLAPYAEDHGLSDRTGALLVGFIGAGSIAGRLILAGFADRLGRRRSVVGAFVGMGVALAWWL